MIPLYPDEGRWFTSPESRAVALRHALQTILDMPCDLGREGDALGAAQRIASEALTVDNQAEKANG